MITVGFLLLFLAEIDDGMTVALVERIEVALRLVGLATLLGIFRFAVEFDLEEIALTGSGLGIHGDEFVLHLDLSWLVGLTILLL